VVDEILGIRITLADSDVTGTWLVSLVILSVYVHCGSRRSIFQRLRAKKYSEDSKRNNTRTTQAATMDKYNNIGCLFRSRSCRNSGRNNIGSDIFAWSCSWLAVCPDQVTISTNLVSRIGKCLLLICSSNGCLNKKERCKMYIRKVLFISKLLLALVLGYVVIITLVPEQKEKNSTPASVRGSNATSVNKATRSSDLSPKDYSEIIEGNPFDSSGQTPSSGKWTSTVYQHSISEELGLALSGTVSGRSEIARAIIKDLKTGTLDLYKIDQNVAGARIESIEENAVVLVCDGQRTILKLNIASSGSNNNTQLSSPQTINGMSKVAKADLSTKKANTNTITKIGYVEAVLNKAAIEPYFVDGQVEGLQITGLENLNIAKNFGLILKNRDVIRSVNGHRLTNKQKAYQVFKKAKSQPTIDIDLLRDNNTKKLSFSM
jgi:type II secretory pathway component PulC